jgi:hypothetical protein
VYGVNVLGQKIVHRTLFNGFLYYGRYGPRPANFRFAWDGRNDKGQLVAAGVYFFRFTAGGRSFAQKVVVL